MNNNTDNNLAFWIEWVKLTEDQRRELISYIDDDETLLFVATCTRNNDIIIRAAYKLTPAGLRRLFDEPNILGEFATVFEFSVNMVECADCIEGYDGLIGYYSRHQSVHVRFQVFNHIIDRLEDDVTNDERDKYFQALQDMMLREPNAEARSEMQQKLDRLTEDSI